MARARQSFVRPGKTIDIKQWTSILSLRTSVQSASGTFSGAGLAFTSPFTILRMRGSLLVYLDESAVLGDQSKIAYGIGIISSDAFTLGPTAMPDPAGEADFPWLYWEEINLGLLETGDLRAFGISSRLSNWDSKAMRKVKPGQTLAWIGQTVNITGDPPMEIQIGQTRVLLGS